MFYIIALEDSDNQQKEVDIEKCSCVLHLHEVDQDARAFQRSRSRGPADFLESEVQVIVGLEVVSRAWNPDKLTHVVRHQHASNRQDARCNQQVHDSYELPSRRQKSLEVAILNCSALVKRGLRQRARGTWRPRQVLLGMARVQGAEAKLYCRDTRGAELVGWHSPQMLRYLRETPFQEVRIEQGTRASSVDRLSFPLRDLPPYVAQNLL